MDHGRAPDRKRGFDETQKDDNDLASKESEKLVKNWRKTLHGASEDDRRSHGEHSSPPNHLQLILTKDAIFARALCTVELLKAKRDILVKLDGRITAIRNNLNIALDRFTQALIKTFRGAPGMTAEDFGFKEYQLVNNPSDRKRYSAQELIDRSTRYALGSKIEMYSSLRYAVGMSACIVHVTLSEVPEHITFADLDTSEAYNYNKVFHLGRFSVTMRDAFRKLTQFMTAITDKIKWIDSRMNQCTGNLAQTGLKDKNEMLKQSEKVLYLRDIRDLDQNTFIQSINGVIDFYELDHFEDFEPQCRLLEEYGRVLSTVNDTSSDQPELEWD